MKEKLLFTLFAIMSTFLLSADLELSPFEYDMVGPAYSGEPIAFISDTLFVTNTGSTEEFTLHLETSEIPNGWNVMWCHDYEDALCHFPIYPWNFDFVSDTVIGIDFSISYSSSPDMLNLDLYWESNSVNEVMNFTFRTEDFVDSDSDELIQVVTLNQNYPNPFNPETRISFNLPQTEKVELNIYDLKGRLINTLENGKLGDGEHQYIWDGKNDQKKEVGSGVYFYQLKTDNKTLTNKMILMK